MHTKGPWIAQEMGSEGWAVFTPKNDGKPGRMVASNLAEEYARLIAAAPELLEALIVAERFMALAIDASPRDYEKQRIVQEAIRKASA